MTGDLPEIFRKTAQNAGGDATQNPDWASLDFSALLALETDDFKGLLPEDQVIIFEHLAEAAASKTADAGALADILAVLTADFRFDPAYEEAQKQKTNAFCTWMMQSDAVDEAWRNWQDMPDDDRLIFLQSMADKQAEFFGFDPVPVGMASMDRDRVAGLSEIWGYWSPDAGKITMNLSLRPNFCQAMSTVLHEGVHAGQSQLVAMNEAAVPEAMRLARRVFAASMQKDIFPVFSKNAALRIGQPIEKDAHKIGDRIAESLFNLRFAPLASSKASFNTVASASPLQDANIEAMTQAEQRLCLRELAYLQKRGVKTELAAARIYMSLSAGGGFARYFGPKTEEICAYLNDPDSALKWRLAWDQIDQIGRLELLGHASRDIAHILGHPPCRIEPVETKEFGHREREFYSAGGAVIKVMRLNPLNNVDKLLVDLCHCQAQLAVKARVDEAANMGEAGAGETFHDAVLEHFAERSGMDGPGKELADYMADRIEAELRHGAIKEQKPTP